MTREAVGEVTQARADSILAWLDEKPSLSRHMTAARRLDELSDASPDDFVALRLLFLRSFTVEPLEPLLRVGAYRVGIHLKVDFGGYDTSGADVASIVQATRPDIVFVALRLEELAPALVRDFLALDHGKAAELGEEVVARVVAFTESIRLHSTAAIVLHNFAAPRRPAAGLADADQPDGQLNLVRRMNLNLAEGLAAVEGAHILDLDHALGLVGVDRSFDVRGERTSDAPLSLDALKALASLHVRYLRAHLVPPAKCLVVDCDNTLWGGVIGEDGIQGISLGEVGRGRDYRDFQGGLLNFRRRGVLLALCSKNEEADVLQVLRDHPDSILREDHFSARRINWLDKAENLQSIANELNLGLAQIVFVDDSPVECAWIRSRLPEVTVIQLPADPSEFRATLEDLVVFDSLGVTAEDRLRADRYQVEAKRRDMRAEIASHDDYLRSLEMVATLGIATQEQMPRLAQLTQRSNQFNLTTRRYDVAGLDQLRRDPDSLILWLDLRDKFGDSGLVGCAILRREKDEAVIDSLLLSCRVLGRNVEQVLVSRLATLARDMGASVLVGTYRPTARNGQVADLYARLGFTGPEPVGDASRWRLPLETAKIETPDWFRIAWAESDDN